MLFSTLACAVPPLLVLATGRLAVAGRLFWFLLALLVLRLVLSGRAGELLCLLVAVSPLVALLREFAFYNVVGAVFALGMIFAAYRAPTAVKAALRNCPLFAALAVAMSLYWALSVLLTGSYVPNFRMFELILAVFVVLLVEAKPAMRAAALSGLTPAACLTGLAMLPHLNSLSAERLGMISIDGYILGNPISLGVPLAFVLLASVADRGRAFGPALRPLLRLSAIIAAAALLALTSSRAAWGIVVVGVTASLLFGRGSRARLVLSVGIGIVVALLILRTPLGEAFQLGLERTLGSERTARQRTTGRSDQWRVAWLATTESAGALLHGYGPGSGPDVYARYSLEVPGVEYGVGERVALHSLLMQVGVETGLLGLVPTLAWLAVVLRKVWCETRRSGHAFPLACFLGYSLIILTVSGTDIFSGLLLGVALSATARRSRVSVGAPGPGAVGVLVHG